MPSRPRGSANNLRDQFRPAPITYWITSSARDRSDSGIVSLGSFPCSLSHAVVASQYR